MRRLLPLLMVLMLTAGCYEQQEGCLDISATNFDVMADQPCPDDCCVYPALKMRFSHVMVLPDSVFNLTLDRFYPLTDAPQDSIAISRLRYYISKVSLFSGMEEFRVADTIELFPLSGSELVINDFGRVEPGASSEPAIGTFPFTGSFDRIRFSFGLDPAIVTTNPSLLPSGHPLLPGADSTLWDPVTGYPSYYMELFPEVAAADSILLRAPGEITMEFTPDEPIEVPGGFDVILEFRADYLSWFVGTEPKIDSPAQLQEALLQNVSGSFLFEGYTLRAN